MTRSALQKQGVAIKQSHALPRPAPRSAPAAHRRPAPLPVELAHLRFERWPGDEEIESFHPIEQEPADIILLTAADTEVLTWSAAVAQLPQGFPSVRALNLDRLRAPRAFDAYL